MIRWFTILILLCAPWSLFSQQVVKGAIYAKDGKSLELVMISNLETDETVYSDSLGNFSISAGPLQLRKSGYNEMLISVRNQNFISITLAPEYQILDEVQVQVQTLPANLKTADESISVLSGKEISRHDPVTITTSLNQIPGVYVQTGALNTNRITIRGTGARSPFGTSGIRTFYGDIPLTDGSGNSAIEDLELAAISSIRVYKGPAAPAYGTGLGGTIVLQPLGLSNAITRASLSGTYGSFGLMKHVGTFETGTPNRYISAVYGRTTSDGYRENNDYLRHSLVLSGKTKLDKKHTLTGLLSLIDLRAFIPSSLTLADFRENPMQAAFTWKESRGNEDFVQTLGGVTWRYDHSPNLAWVTSAFGSYRYNYESRPFNILDETSFSKGIRTRIMGGNRIRWVAGGEFFHEDYRASLYENLYQQDSLSEGSIPGNNFSTLIEDRYFYNVFVQSRISLASKLKLNLALNLNQTFFRVEDRFSQDRSGAFDYEPILTPKMALTYQPSNFLSSFINISRGFSTPTSEETLLPEGIFNRDLKPASGWNTELGGKLFINNFSVMLSAYRAQIENQLVTRRTPEGEFFSINAGSTVQNGIEGELTHLLNISQTSIHTYVTASIFNYRFDEFVDNNEDFSGNDLTGVPSSVVNAGCIVSTKYGISLAGQFRMVGAMPVNDSNTAFAESYELLNLKLGYGRLVFKTLKIELNLGVNNVLNEKYAAQAQVNARGFGSNEPRYYYPGLPRHFFTSVKLSFTSASRD